MTSNLKDYFPMIRSREEILKEIQDNIKFTEKFYSWRESERQEFLDFCTGIRGVNIGNSTRETGRFPECFTSEKGKNRRRTAGRLEPDRR